MALTQVDQGLLGTYAQYTGFKNRLINGAMAVNQRGGGTSLTNTYGLDRWGGWRGAYAANLDMSQQAGFSGFQYCMRAQRTSGTSSTQNMNVAQIIETLNCYDLAGKNVTVSGILRVGSNYSGGGVTVQVVATSTTDATMANLSSGSTFNFVNSVVATTSTTATPFTLTAAIPAGTKTIAVQFIWNPTGTAGANDYIELDGVQLEAGSTATSFDYRPYGTELALCQRYYYKNTRTGTTYADYGIGLVASATSGYGLFVMPVEMRAAPTASISGDVTFNDAGVNSSFSSITATYTSKNTVSLGVNTGGGLTTGRAMRVICNNSSTAVIDFSAEL